MQFFAFKEAEEATLAEEKKSFRLKLRNNNEATARLFMNTDKRAQRLVKSLAKRMKTEVGI